jgi:hypothetical protein
VKIPDGEGRRETTPGQYGRAERRGGPTGMGEIDTGFGKETIEETFKAACKSPQSEGKFANI